jgi:HK97 family phage portal protein
MRLPAVLTRLAAAIRRGYTSDSLWGRWGYGSGFISPGPERMDWWQTYSRYYNRYPPETLLAFSALYACVTILASDIAKLPIYLYEDLPNGGVRRQRTNPIQRILSVPNGYQTRTDFIQQLMTSTLLTGNAYVYVEFDNRQVAVAWHVLNPESVRPVVTPDGEVFYRVGAGFVGAIGADSNALAGLINDAAQGYLIPMRELMHHRYCTIFHPLIGSSPMQAAAMSAITGSKVVANSAEFFANMSRTSGVITAPTKIDQETADRLKTVWEENFSHGRFGRTAVLGGGLKWEPLTINAVDAQLIEQLRWTVEDVARPFRVPLFMLGEQKISFRNAEHMGRTYLAGALSYLIEALEDRMMNFFDIAYESNPLSIQFDLEAMLRAEIDSRYDAIRLALSSGLMSVNEARSREGLAPVDGGSEPFIQMQYVPVSVAAAAAPAGRVPPPAEVVPAAPQPVPGKELAQAVKRRLARRNIALLH